MKRVPVSIKILSNQDHMVQEQVAMFLNMIKPMAASFGLTIESHSVGHPTNATKR